MPTNRFGFGLFICTAFFTDHALYSKLIPEQFPQRLTNNTEGNSCLFAYRVLFTSLIFAAVLTSLSWACLTVVEHFRVTFFPDIFDRALTLLLCGCGFFQCVQIMPPACSFTRVSSLQFCINNDCIDEH
jgi:hypothetical protein